MRNLWAAPAAGGRPGCAATYSVAQPAGQMAATRPDGGHCRRAPCHNELSHFNALREGVSVSVAAFHLVCGAHRNFEYILASFSAPAGSLCCDQPATHLAAASVVKALPSCWEEEFYIFALQGGLDIAHRPSRRLRAWARKRVAASKYLTTRASPGSACAPGGNRDHPKVYGVCACAHHRICAPAEQGIA